MEKAIIAILGLTTLNFLLEIRMTLITDKLTANVDALTAFVPVVVQAFEDLKAAVIAGDTPNQELIDAVNAADLKVTAALNTLTEEVQEADPIS